MAIIMIGGERSLLEEEDSLCLATGPCFSGETVVPTSVTVGYQNVDLHGVMVLGNKAGTPEPGACLLFMTGLAS